MLVHQTPGKLASKTVYGWAHDGFQKCLFKQRSLGEWENASLMQWWRISRISLNLISFSQELCLCFALLLLLFACASSKRTTVINFFHNGVCEVWKVYFALCTRENVVMRCPECRQSEGNNIFLLLIVF